MRRGAVALALALAALGGAAARPAFASCPPYSGPSSPFEPLAAGSPAATGRSQAEAMEWMRRNVPPLMVVPSTGPAPLTVDVRWFYWPVNDPAKVEVDLDGDGSADVSQRDYGSPWEHTYRRPGRYDITAWIHERDGRVHRVAVPVEVVAAQAFETELFARWDTFKARLKAGDVSGALDCVHSASRRRYASSLTTLFASGTTPVDEVFTALTLVRIWRGTAELSMARQSVGRPPMSYPVRFTIDGDGVWRINAF